MLIYKAVQSNIASKDKKKKWHPCLFKMGNVVDTQMIGETIAERSSLTAGDVQRDPKPDGSDARAVAQQPDSETRRIGHIYHGVPVTLQGGGCGSRC